MSPYQAWLPHSSPVHLTIAAGLGELPQFSPPEEAVLFPLFSPLLRTLSYLGEPPRGEGHVLTVSGVGRGRDMGLMNSVTPSESSVPHNLVGIYFVPGTKPGVGDTKINK